MPRALSGLLLFLLSACGANADAPSYPWHDNIVTTVFWIDPQNLDYKSKEWTTVPVPNDLVWHGEGRPAKKELPNPYYVALPFDDAKYPDLARRWMPGVWPKPDLKKDPRASACKNRWIEMKNSAGKVCYGQWEDVGPIVTNDAAYVFGKQQPMAHRGLDVSPAIAKYLGIDSTAQISWRFVDDEDVPSGAWLRAYQNQLLIDALKKANNAD